MLAVTRYKIKALLLIAMLGIAEVRQLLQEIRFLADDKLQSGSPEPTDSGMGKNSGMHHKDLKAIGQAAKLMEVIRRNPTLKEQAQLVVEKLGAVKAKPNFQNLSKFLAKQRQVMRGQAKVVPKHLETLLANPIGQKQAKLVTERIETIMANWIFQQQVKRNATQIEAQMNMNGLQMEEIKSQPRVQEQPEVVVKYPGTMHADVNVKVRAQHLAEQIVRADPHAKFVVRQMEAVKVNLSFKMRVRLYAALIMAAFAHAGTQDPANIVVPQEHGKDFDYKIEKNNWLDRLLKASPLLDKTILGKSRHDASIQWTKPRPLPSRHKSQRSTRYFIDFRSPWPSHWPKLPFVHLAIADLKAKASPGADDISQELSKSANDISQELSKSLDVSGPLSNFLNGGELDVLGKSVLGVLEQVTKDASRGAKTDASESIETALLDSIGHDLLIFLICASVATPLARLLSVTPILTYLGFGALLGPHAFDVFTSSKADVELGDFGILFLLFAEGLEVSSERFGQLATFLPLGVAQISMTAGVLSFVISKTQELERFLPLDAGLINSLININSPSEVLILALAGTLSTSAFVFPVLKERGWEEQDVGKAATSILLLQDLFVAPLLVLLPFIAGKGAMDTNVMAELTTKATLGFGAVVVVGSYLLRACFEVVAKTRSPDTFVAFSLLVAVGMGAIAKTLGLTDTVGAFAAGVVLANTNYKYEISASILPFRSILLGVFFLDAGCNFDPELLVREGPTIATGVSLLLVLKAFTLWIAGAIDQFLPTPTRLSPAENVRLSILLAGGGEFAFVVLAASEKLGVFRSEINSLLTTIILITMSITPFLGTAAVALSEPLAQRPLTNPSGEVQAAAVASDAIVICGYGEVGFMATTAILKGLENVACNASVRERVKSRTQVGQDQDGLADDVASIVCFDLNPERLSRGVRERGVVVRYGDGSNAELVRATGVVRPRAIIVTYSDATKCLLATQRLRAAFPNAPIYARANSRSERNALIANGASKTILETQELAVQLGACLLFNNGSFKLSREVQADGAWEKAVRTLRTVVSLDKAT